MKYISLSEAVKRQMEIHERLKAERLEGERAEYEAGLIEPLTDVDFVDTNPHYIDTDQLMQYRNHKGTP